LTSDRDIRAALDGDPHDLAKGLLSAGEGQWFDRKSVAIDPKRLAETLVAFANAEGGTVAVGFKGREIEGVAGRPDRVNAFRQAGLDHCDPPVKVRWFEASARDEHGRQISLLIGDVPPSTLVHSTKGDVVLLRVGDENRRLSFAQRQELIYDKGQAQFDGIAVPNATIGDLSPERLDEFASRIGSPDSLRALAARGLTNSAADLTTAAVLLFGNQPQLWFPSAYVRVLRYAGLTRESGSRQRLTADIRCEGPIPQILDEARRAVDRLQPKRRVLGPDGRFVLQAMIPEDAWMEGIVNAVVHRSYSLGGDHVRVEVFDDRIEIESPGPFPGLIRTADLPNVTRFARNSRIARACADLSFGQELGEGIRRMYAEMRSRGLADPLYSESPATVRLVLTSIVADGRILGQFRPEFLQIMDIVRRGEHLSTGDVAEAAGLSRPTAKSRLRGLQDLGFVEWVGKSANDPRAYWRMRTE
jgi:ATP-dependent DNA helicase RecG